MARTKKRSVSFKVTGAAHFMSPEAFNKGIEEWSDFNAEFYFSLAHKGEIEPLKRGFNLGGEIIFHVSRHLGIGIGSGYFFA